MEYRLEVKGDDFYQGDSLPCQLSVKNHGIAAANLEGAFLKLAVGDLKKVKEKKEDAFDEIQEIALPALAAVEPGKEQSCEVTVDDAQLGHHREGAEPLSCSATHPTGLRVSSS